MQGIKKKIAQGLRTLLPRRVKDSLLHLSFNIDQEEFEKFAFLYAMAPNMELGLKRLAERGFAPESIVDVGCSQGAWSRSARSIWPTARLAMIEPNLGLKDKLKAIASELKGEFQCELMGAVDGAEVTFYVMGAGSSIYEERSDINRTAEKRQTRTLDSVLSNWDRIGLLKIDAQGSELDILKGSSRLLPGVEAVLLEISVLEINQGAPLLHEVVAFMAQDGFVICEILEIHRRLVDMALIQLDFLFVRHNSPLLADKRQRWA